LLFIATAAIAQKAPSDYWTAKKPAYAERSFASLVIDKVELTPRYTIVTFIYNNKGNGETMISACNSFKLMANGKRIATIVKTVGIPMTDVIRRPFHCAELPEAKIVRGNETVRFDLYFTPIPKDVEYIDVIEYNGTESCEYDVYKVDIRRKTPLTPSPEDRKFIADNENKKTPKADPPKPLAQNNKNTKDSKKDPKTTTIKPPKVAAKDTATKRNVVEKTTVAVKTRKVQVEIWDKDKEDGDIISLQLNGTWLLRNLEVRKEPYKTTLELKAGENVLVMQAENLGTKPPNTAAIKVDDGVNPPRTIVLNSDMGKSESIKITVE
jgi:hypothetical protein